MSIAYISWAPHCSRSDHTARELGGVSHMVYLGWLGSHPLTVGFKYIGQAWQTWRILRRERPQAVFVMVPPIFAAATVWLYSVIWRVPFVLDTHTAAFLHPRWASWQWLQQALSRRAATTIVTNEHLANAVRGVGGRVTLVPDVPVRFTAVQPLERASPFIVAVVCSFNYDEPVAQMFDAARELPDVTFMVTGNPRHLSSDVKRDLPENVRLTGFLPDAAYAGLVIGADAVMTLTTRDHTMLRGAYEAIYQGTPVIVSDWPVLRASFDEGAIHVDNSAPVIAEAVRLMRREHNVFRAGAERLRRRKLERWAATLADLRLAVGLPCGLRADGAVDLNCDSEHEVVR
jgi:glycosyltransferase involved in cell wall biosynthesis